MMGICPNSPTVLYVMNSSDEQIEVRLDVEEASFVLAPLSVSEGHVFDSDEDIGKSITLSVMEGEEVLSEYTLELLGGESTVEITKTVHGEYQFQYFSNCF